MTERRHSLRWRLTASYAVAFAVCLVCIFLALDRFLRAASIRQADALLASEADRILDLASRRKDRILQTEFERFALFHGADKIYVRLLNPDGSQAAGSAEPAAWADAGLLSAAPRLGAPAGRIFRTDVAGRDRIRSVFAGDGHGRVLHVARSLADADQPLRAQRWILSFGLLLSLAAGTLAAFAVTSRIVRRMDEVRAAAAGMASGDPFRRVDVGKENDEIRDLGLTFNEMIERIERLMNELRAVSDNIAHELRTPITRIRGAAEAMLTGEPRAGEAREAAALVVEECDHLKHMIDAMLQIARLEAGKGLAESRPVNLNGLVRDALEAFEPLLEQNGLRWTVSLPDEAMEVRGDRSSLQRMVGNLLDNAVKYTPRNGLVAVALRRVGELVELSVEDTGVGIAEQDLPHVFERFYRSGAQRQGPGSGLGLSLVQAIVRAHGGTIGIRSAAGKGTRLCVSIPGLFA